VNGRWLNEFVAFTACKRRRTGAGILRETVLRRAREQAMHVRRGPTLIAIHREAR
jgi:hypothetical protein